MVINAYNDDDRQHDSEEIGFPTAIDIYLEDDDAGITLGLG